MRRRARLAGGVRRRWIAVLAVALSLGLVASACGGGSSSGGSGASTSSHGSVPVANALNYNFVGPPLGLQPAKNGIGDSANFTILDYDSLVYWAPDGSLKPDLATSWKYVGSGNRVFEFTLRPGVKFQDGTSMDANAVKASIDYFRSVHGPEQSLTSSLQSVAVTGPMTVQLTFTQSVPEVALLFSQQYEAGAIIGPKGLADPASLDTQSDGTGPFVLDWSHSVTNDHYTYTANPNYWNRAAVHYKQIVVHVLGQPNAITSALQTGQLDFSRGPFTPSPQMATSAKSSGLTVKSVPFTPSGLVLADRGGTVLKPLGDLRVRQAINYAIDRNGITKALFGQYAAPTTQVLGRPGNDAYVAGLNNYYPYNPGQAKKLLAEAGYPNGFTLPVLDSTLIDQNNELAQAIASELGKVGIKVQITNVSASLNEYFGQLLAKKYPAEIGGAAGGVDGYTSGQTILPLGTGNPFGTVDPQMDSWYMQANASSDASKRASLYQNINKRLVEQAWFAPVGVLDSIYFVRPNIQNVRFSEANPTPQPTSPDPSLGWYTSNGS